MTNEEYEEGLRKAADWANVLKAVYHNAYELVAAAKTEVVFAEAYRCGYAAGAAAEREACAKVCKDFAGALDAATAIRARGTT